MDKLTLEHLAPYLPYGLKAEMLNYKCDYVGKKYDEIIGFHQWDKNCLYWSALTVGGSKPNIERIKPILRPLSDITKEIEHKGVSFIPLLLLAKIENYENNYLDDDENGVPIIGKDVSDFDMGSMTYAHTYRFRFDEELKLFVVDLLDEDGSMISELMSIATRNFDLIKKLFEWHFDVFGLIEKGLAIDINSIEGKETNS